MFYCSVCVLFYYLLKNIRIEVIKSLFEMKNIYYKCLINTMCWFYTICTDLIHEYYNCTLFICGSPFSKITIKINTQSSYIYTSEWQFYFKYNIILIGWLIGTVADIFFKSFWHNKFVLDAWRKRFVLVVQEEMPQSLTSAS